MLAPPPRGLAPPPRGNPGSTTDNCKSFHFISQKINAFHETRVFDFLGATKLQTAETCVQFDRQYDVARRGGAVAGDDIS